MCIRVSIVTINLVRYQLLKKRDRGRGRERFWKCSCECETRYGCLSDLCHDGCARMAGQHLIKILFFCFEGRWHGDLPGSPLCVASFFFLPVFHFFCTPYSSISAIYPQIKYAWFGWVVSSYKRIQPIQGRSLSNYLPAQLWSSKYEDWSSEVSTTPKVQIETLLPYLAELVTELYIFSKFKLLFS
jgi:hypothetical protein